MLRISDHVWATGKRRGFESFKSESLGILVIVKYPEDPPH